MTTTLTSPCLVFNASLHLSQPNFSPPQSSDSNLAALIEREFINSGYPLHNVRCELQGSKILLSGFVPRYYFLQMALLITRRLGPSQQIFSHVEVIAVPPENSEVVSTLD